MSNVSQHKRKRAMSKLHKNTLLVSAIFLATTLIQGCSSTGMMTAGHNGKKYWNPGNCSQYRYYNNNPDRIYCVSNGQENGVVLEPVSQQQLENYYRENEISNKSSRNSNYNSPSNTVSCYRFGDLSFNKEIRTFSGGVCPMGWLEAF